MGKKTSTRNIFQIGKNNKKYIWNSKYFEKKKKESSIFIFQSVAIEKFIGKILKDNGLILYKYKIDFLNSSIKIFISYFKTPKSQSLINQININQKLKLIKNNNTNEPYKENIKEYLNNKKFIKNKKQLFKKTINLRINKNYLNKENIDKQKTKFCLINHIILNKEKKISKKKLLKKKNLNLYLNYIFIKKAKYKINNFLINNKEKHKNLKKITNKLSINKDKIKKRIKILKYYKYFLKITKNKIIKNIKIDNFLEKIIESLNIFTNNKFNIILNLQQVNKNITFETDCNHLQYLKKVTIQLRQFKKSKFFKEGINIIFLSIIKNESAQILANFIANQLKLVKRHGFFLKFIKKTISLMLNNKIIKNKSIKIIIKGRFNGKSRASKKVITINKNMPLMTIKSKIESAQSTSYDSNGTFGVKLWINERL